MDKDKDTKTAKYGLGVALTGGGARGFAHAGALAAIEEAGLKPEVIAGVSAGSIVAALYAAGVRPTEFLEIFSNRNFRDFVNLRPRSGGIFSTAPFRAFIEENLHGYRNLEDLPVPVYLGVTDFDHGVPAEFHTGAIAERVVASCTIPIVFKPVVIDGVTYVDGGVLRNHPAWIIRDKCEKLIGINVSPLDNKVKTDSFLSVAMRTYNLMAKANQRVDMNMCDINVEPIEIQHYSTFDLRYTKEVYFSGYIHTRRALRDEGLWPGKQTTKPTDL